MLPGHPRPYRSPPARPRSLSPWPTSTPLGRDLEAALGAERVLADPLTRRLYARDASMVEGSCALVAFPASTDDVVACVRAAREHGLAVVPRGSGTGLAGGATPIGDALVVVTDEDEPRSSRSARRTDSRGWSRACSTSTCPSRSRPLGFTYAPDPSRQQTSSIGGNVSTNAGGPHCLAYGVTSRARARGRRRAGRRLGGPARERRRPRPPATTCAACVVGSEGTLGVVAGRLRASHAAPAPRCARCCSTSPRWRTARRPSRRSSPRASCPAAVEMMDHGIVRGRRERSRTPATRPTPPRSSSWRSTARTRPCEAQIARRGGGGTGARRAHDPRGRRRHRARADLEGTQVRVRRRRADRPALPPARLRGAAHELARGVSTGVYGSPSATT